MQSGWTHRDEGVQPQPLHEWAVGLCRLQEAVPNGMWLRHARVFQDQPAIMYNAVMPCTVKKYIWQQQRK